MADEPPASSPPDDRPPTGRGSKPADGVEGGRAPYPTLSGTGFYKPLPAAGRFGRLVSGFGLFMGRRLALVVRDDHAYLILMAAVVGVASGFAAALLLTWIEWAYQLFPRPEAGTWLRWAVVVGVPALGGLVAGWLQHLSVRYLDAPVLGGVTEVIAAVDRNGGRLEGRRGVVLGLGTGITIGSGGSVGHEGPMVAIGATAGSVVARFFGLRARRHVAMVGAGCAAGIGASFNAPLAGVIFTVELIFGRGTGGSVGTMSVFIPLIVAAVAGTFTSHAIFGPRPEFLVEVSGSGSALELSFVVLLAVAAGLTGSAMTRMVTATRRAFVSMRAPGWLKPAIGGLGVGLLAAASSNAVLGSGRLTVDAALHGNLLWSAAFILLGLKLVATALTVGSGGFGGVIMPALYVGSCLGVLVAALAGLVLGEGASAPEAYALIGMGALLGAVFQAPLTPIVMIFELTHNYGIILPLMLGCILASLVTRRIDGHNLFERLLRDQGIVLRHEAEGEIMKRGRVSTLMRPVSGVLTRGALLDEVRTAVLEPEPRTCFVVDMEGAVVGSIEPVGFTRRLLSGELHPEATAVVAMESSRLTFLYGDDTLAGAMLAFARTRQEALPVVDRQRKLVGELRRGDLIDHYSENVLGKEEGVVQVAGGAHSPDGEVGLSAGVILERTVVGRAGAGKTLVELDLRGRVGVVVLEWRRGEEVMALDPRAPLREGDVLAVVGTRGAILQSRELL